MSSLAHAIRAKTAVTRQFVGLVRLVAAILALATAANFPSFARAAEGSRPGWSFASDADSSAVPLAQKVTPAIQASGATWQELRSRALLNTVHGIVRAPGTQFLCAVGDGQYGQTVGAPGAGPLVCRSWDNGRTWTFTQPTVATGPLSGPVRVNFQAVSFPTALQGWAVGCIGEEDEVAAIYHTTDGGATWQLQYNTAPNPWHKSFLDVCFVDSLRGWAVGAIDPGSNVAITATTDGGRTWHTQPTGVNALVSQVYFLDRNVGFALANLDYTLRTVDGGNTWTIAGTNSGYLQSWGLVFLDALHGFAADGNAIQSTSDGGATWSQVLSVGNDLYGLDFSDPTNGIAVGDYGVSGSTHDGGLTWQQTSTACAEPLMACVALDESTACAVGKNGMMVRTGNAQQTWSQVDGLGYATGDFLRGLDFIDLERGWLVGNWGQMIRTTDGGATWTRQSVNGEENLGGVKFTSAQVGWACSTYGIWSTTDGGDHWQRSYSSGQSLINVYARGDQLAWALGSSGAVLRTIDGGQTWDSPPTGTTEGLYGISFVNEHQGWVVGWSGTILHTNDGGLTWQSQISGTTSPLYAVSFPDSLQGWVVGLDGIVLHTQDGGGTWEPQNFVTLNLSGVSFVDPSCGCISGGYVGRGYIACTSDAGATWTESYVPVPQQKIMAIDLPDRWVGYAVGFEGRILKSTDLLPRVTSVPDAHPVNALRLDAPRPNPGRAALRLSFALPVSDPAVVELLDAAGRLVLWKVIARPTSGPGQLELAPAAAFAPGVYFVRLRQGDRAVSRKVVLLGR